MNLFHLPLRFGNLAPIGERVDKKFDSRRSSTQQPSKEQGKRGEQLAFDWTSPNDDFSEGALERSSRLLLELAGAGDLARKVKVRWNARLRTTAGLACFGSYLVSLNPRLIPFGMPEVDRTLRHELAHLLARHRAGRRRIAPHGAEWKVACCDLGLTDEKRCHDLPLPRRVVEKKLLYRCGACGLEVPRVRPFRRAVACLKCCRTYNHGKYDPRFRLAQV